MWACEVRCTPARVVEAELKKYTVSNLSGVCTGCGSVLKGLAEGLQIVLTRFNISSESFICSQTLPIDPALLNVEHKWTFEKATTKALQ